jgi:hypothetical protein
MSRTWHWTDKKTGQQFTHRSSKPKRELRNVESIETVDCFFEVDAFDHELNVNTVDPAMDIDGSAEFGDHDDITQGLTLVEPDGVLETARFLNGYAVE